MDNHEREALHEIWGAIQIVASLQYNVEEAIRTLHKVAENAMKKCYLIDTDTADTEGQT